MGEGRDKATGHLQETAVKGKWWIPPRRQGDKNKADPLHHFGLETVQKAGFELAVVRATQQKSPGITPDLSTGSS